MTFPGKHPGDFYFASTDHAIFISNQIKSIFIYTAQNRNHIASMGFTICTVSDILCLKTLHLVSVQLPLSRLKKNEVSFCSRTSN